MFLTVNKKRFIRLCGIEVDAWIKAGLLKQHNTYELLCDYTTQVRKTLATMRNDESLFNNVKTTSMFWLMVVLTLAQW